MSHVSLDDLLEACRPGGASVLTSVTPLEPAAGSHASVAPAKFLRGNSPVFAFERRYVDGKPVDVALLDSKQSQGNRLEAAVSAAVADGDPVLSSLPRIELRFEDGPTYSDLDLPHRAFDGQIRAGTIGGRPATDHPDYRALRDATPSHARALLERSPMTLILGGWDASRRSHQGRYRSILVGEIIGVLADQDTSGPDQISMRGGARIDPLGAQIKLSDKAIKLIADQQKSELTKKTYDSAVKNKKASTLGLGGIAPSLDQLGGVSCREIIRSHVLSFAALRSLRFDCETTEGNVACRALLAALALNGLARSDAELLLRANCDLVESEPARVTLDKRYGEKAAFKALTIDQAQELLSAALEHARTTAGVAWDGSVLAVTGNPEILRAAEDTRDE